MKFYTADLHFFHERIINFTDRPYSNQEEMHRELISNWNKKVTNKDEVYILGDFAFTKDGEAVNNILKHLNGKKYLIEGNHDLFLKNKNFDKDLFEKITPYLRISENLGGSSVRVILCHYPIAVWDCKHHGSIHLYGHVHNHADEKHPMLKQLKSAYNVGVDVWDYAPVTLHEILGLK